MCSSRVGGEGLTLTEANHAVFINEWWGPSANAQARDRVVRLGQERVVHVHRFRCKGTIEEVLDQILARKSEAFANIVDALASGAYSGLQGQGGARGGEGRGDGGPTGRPARGPPRGRFKLGRNPLWRAPPGSSATVRNRRAGTPPPLSPGCTRRSAS